MNAPPAPSGVRCSQGQYEDRIRIVWNDTAYAAGYEFWRSREQKYIYAEKIGLRSNSALYFDDMDAEVGVPYFYWVKAVNDYGVSGFSLPNFGVRKGGGPEHPPEHVKVSDIYWDRIRISWSPSPNTYCYEVWRSMVGNTKKAARIAKDVKETVYTDESTFWKTPYYYWIKAVNIYGKSDFSESDKGAKIIPEGE